jgi:hypothetical protein
VWQGYTKQEFANWSSGLKTKGGVQAAPAAAHNSCSQRAQACTKENRPGSAQAHISASAMQATGVSNCSRVPAHRLLCSLAPPIPCPNTQRQSWCTTYPSTHLAAATAYYIQCITSVMLACDIALNHATCKPASATPAPHRDSTQRAALALSPPYLAVYRLSNLQVRFCSLDPRFSSQ